MEEKPVYEIKKRTYTGVVPYISSYSFSCSDILLSTNRCTIYFTEVNHTYFCKTAQFLASGIIYLRNSSGSSSSIYAFNRSAV